MNGTCWQHCMLLLPSHHSSAYCVVLYLIRNVVEELFIQLLCGRVSTEHVSEVVEKDCHAQQPSPHNYMRKKLKMEKVI